MTATRKALLWAALLAIIAVPLALSLNSPLLAWRNPIYILAGIAGMVAMALLVVQPLLVAGTLPGLPGNRGRNAHRWGGAGLALAVVVHVAALWATSPPDVVDALLFSSPTPFSVWGVVAMWAVFAAGSLAWLRELLKLRPKLWRLLHVTFVTAAITGSVVHAMLIEGTMETVSKAVLCAAVLIIALRTFMRLKVWALFAPQRR